MNDEPPFTPSRFRQELILRAVHAIISSGTGGNQPHVVAERAREIADEILRQEKGKAGK